MMRALWTGFWRQRWLRWTLMLFVLPIMAWICFCLILNSIGEKRWQQVKARLESEGETFDYFAVLPPTIPDDQNFCAIEPLNGLRKLHGNPQSSMLADRKRDEIARQSAFLTPKDLSLLHYNALHDARLPDDQTMLEVLSRIGSASAGNKAPIKTWQELKRDFESRAPILMELCQAARERPLAEHLPRPQRHELPDMLLMMSFDQIDACHKLSTLCRIYSIISLRSGDVPASRDAARVLLRLGAAAQSQSSLLGNLVAVTHQSIFLSLLWLHLEGRHLDDADLALMQRELQSFDVTEDHLASLRAEMALSADAHEYLNKHPVERREVLSNVSGLTSSSSLERFIPQMSAWIPNGFFDMNEASGTELFYKHALQPLKQTGLRHLASEIAILQTTLETFNPWRRMDLILPKVSLPSFFLIHRMVIPHENQRLQALLACALERHYIRHHAYPPTLEVMDPDFLKGLSLLDVVGDKMHYAVTPGGRFRLWSSGPDGIDDGGQFGTEIGSGTRSRSFTHSSYRGDWVWRYDPAIDKP